MEPSKNIAVKSRRMDKTRLVKYKKGEEPNDILYWLTQPIIERIKALELLRMEYNQWKYGTQSGFQRVYRAVKRKKS